MKMKTGRIWHALIVFVLSLAMTVTMMPLGWQSAFAATKDGGDEETLSTKEQVFNQDKVLPAELDPSSERYNEALAEGELYGADHTQNLQ